MMCSHGEIIQTLPTLGPIMDMLSTCAIVPKLTGGSHVQSAKHVTSCKLLSLLIIIFCVQQSLQFGLLSSS